MNDELRRFLTNRTAGYAELETFAIAHSNFTKAYHITRSIAGGFDGELETGEIVHFQYVPMKLNRASMNGDLDYALTITLQDLNEIIKPELARIPLDSKEKPRVIMRSFLYRRNRTISTVADGPFNLEMGPISFSPRGCTFKAEALSLNQSATGVVYSVKDFPMLKGYIV